MMAAWVAFGIVMQDLAALGNCFARLSLRQQGIGQIRYVSRKAAGASRTASRNSAMARPGWSA